MSHLTLSPEDRAALAIEVAAQVLRMLDARKEPPLRQNYTARCTVAAFAFVIERGAKHVRRMIRSRKIPATDVDGPPYLIHVRAFKVFNVTPDLYFARLALWESR